MSRARVAVLLVVVAVAAAVALRACDGGHESAQPVATVAPPIDARPAAALAPRPRHERDDAAKPTDEASPPSTSSTPEPPPAAPPPHEGPTGVAIDVADESGAAVRGAAVRLWIADFKSWGSPGIQSVFALTRHEYRPEAGETITLDVPSESDGIPVKVGGVADDFPPFAPVVFTIHAGKVEKVRLVATKPRTATVIVIDAATDRPIAGARVVSATEGDRRHDVDLERPAPTVAGADGRCVVEGLSAGDHKIEVRADRYEGAHATWTGGQLRVRLLPQSGGAKVVVKVLGPYGVPIPNLAVTLLDTERVVRVVKTDVSGVATFEDTAPGSATADISFFEWHDALAAADLPATDPRSGATAWTKAGGTYELVLGVPPAVTGLLDGRLLHADGSPAIGVEVVISAEDVRDRSVVADAAGRVRFSELPAGSYRARVSCKGNRWSFDNVALADGGHASATWTLGSATIRGRVVAGPDHHGVEGVLVWFRGPNTGAAKSYEDGRFELRYARAGTYSVDAQTESAAAVKSGVTVPTDEDVVVELLDFGGVAVRFLAADRKALLSANIQLFAVGVTDHAVGRLRPGTGDDDLVRSWLLPGRYEIEVVLDDRKRRFPVEVKSGATSVVEVRAP